MVCDLVFFGQCDALYYNDVVLPQGSLESRIYRKARMVSAQTEIGVFLQIRGGSFGFHVVDTAIATG
jgi:hypothetical protein